MVKSNKLFKILTIMLVAICLVTAFCRVVNAITPTDIKAQTVTTGDEKIKNVGGSVLGIIQAVGIAAGVVIIAYMGVKYITSSPDGKAEIKKQAAVYVLGAAFLMLAPTVASIVFNLVGDTSTSAS